MADVQPTERPAEEPAVPASPATQSEAPDKPVVKPPTDEPHPTHDVAEPLTVDDAEALLKYVMDHRIDVGESLLADLYRATAKFRDAKSTEQKNEAHAQMLEGYGSLIRAVMSEPLPIEQVKALIRYAAERGIGIDDDILVNLYRSLREYQAASDFQARTDAATALIKHYTALAKLTYDANRINGKTLLGTARSNKEASVILVIGAVFFAFASLNGILGLWPGDQAPAGTEGDTAAPLSIFRYALMYLTPFFWGGLGACVFIAKRIADETAELRFDYERYKGVAVRIFLGAVLGGLAVSIYDVGTFSDTGFKLQASGLAFLAGLGYKVVYGSFEKAIEVIADKLNLGTVSSPKPLPRTQPGPGK